jgi:hypothetical protein
MCHLDAAQLLLRFLRASHSIPDCGPRRKEASVGTLRKSAATHRLKMRNMKLQFQHVPEVLPFILGRSAHAADMPCASAA